MAFIQAALSEFNNEDLNAFRTRAFRIISGCAEDGDIHGTKDVECNEEIRLETGIASCPLTGLEHANS
jgi:hypothetical protein